MTDTLTASVPTQAPDWEEIRSVMALRRSEDSPLKRSMIEVKERYNGDYVIPLPSVENEPALNPPIPNLIADAIDNTALSAASVSPEITVPAVDETKPRGTRSLQFANKRKRAYFGTWYKNSMDLLISRAYRHMYGYGEMALVTLPDPQNEEVLIEIRDPLTSYPDPRDAEDVRRPTNVGFVFGRSTSWIARNYPEFRAEFAQQPDDKIWDLVEWIDEWQVAIGVLGPRHSSSQRAYGQDPSHIDRYGKLLRRYRNLVGFCPVAATRRVTMDRISGAVSSMIPNVDLLGTMMALDVLATEKAIFPDRFIIGSDFGYPELLNDRWYDGREGVPNILANTSQIGELNSSPGPMTQPVTDRLEGSIRQTMGPTPAQSGMTTSGLRTGRAYQQHMEASVQPTIQDLQRTMSKGLTVVNESIHETYRNYFPSTKYHFLSGWPTDHGKVEFTPEKHFESKDNIVYYPFPGADVNMVTQIVMSTNSAGLTAKRTARIQHPFIQNPEQEEQKIFEEGLDEALFARLQAQANEGELPLTDLARIRDLVSQNYTLQEAIIQTNEEAQERQSTPAGEQQPAQPPETQPGISPGAEQPSPGPPGGPGGGGPGPGGNGSGPSPERFQQIMQALGGGG